MTKGIDTTVGLAQHYAFVRRQSLALCAPLQPEDYVVQACEDVSPPKWHLGHTTWFFENFVLAKYVPDYQLFDGKLNWFFNSYYESQGPRILRSNRGNMTRPALSVILAYREHVDRIMADLLRREPQSDELNKLIELGLHHEQQHQELLLTDIKYTLGTNPLYPAYREAGEHGPDTGYGDLGAMTAGAGFRTEEPGEAMTFSHISGGIHTIGHRGDGFCWDNELSVHQVLLEDFLIGDRLVTAGEYLAFMQDGGYERFELWQMEGIEWARTLEVKAPQYWYPDEAGNWFHYRLNGGLVPVDPHLPVTHVSWYEADAFARWAEARLPTEFEWEIAAARLQPEIPADGNWVESTAYHPQRATSGDPQFLGHAWEWTNSSYLPYPRYPRPEGALGEYNGKFMVNHMVLRGGSCATPLSHIRPTYRNFFQTDKRWQFTGIRLAKDVENPRVPK
ncbi:ergothioneine biosynthesis protein EgtB [Lewinella sp. W8]|uniref:ergothioneine biosynthesis protein EgtB n=1 Tax=Lewinella sp. W8 TaxID=2528208 RepID=UPI001068CB5B|nr:ergothioneine biosynthesis protein EgtB [Lewinella sp. W8]MTB49376.1 ergothioneine biosynthesis protein EgtB [Lewinella sp. W8]